MELFSILPLFVAPELDWLDCLRRPPPALVLVFVSLVAIEIRASLSLDVDVVAITIPVSSLSEESVELSRVNGVLRIWAALCKATTKKISAS